jgi:hypothetical protein
MRMKGRRGVFAPMLVFLLLMLLGFGALSLNVARLGQCRVEAESIAASAARAGVMVLRAGGSTGDADGAIVALAAANNVCGTAPSIETIIWGRWDDTVVNPSFVATAIPPNAVRVGLGRAGAGAVETFLGDFIGVNAVDVHGVATAAVRSQHLVVIVEIQQGLSESAFLQVKQGLIDGVDVFGASAAPADKVAIIVTSGPFAWELVPLTSVGDASGLASVQADLQQLALASFAGTQISTNDGVDCTAASGPSEDDFSSPSGGCYPEMPRRYSDEEGSDLSVALDLARAEFIAEVTTPAVRSVAVFMYKPYSAVPSDAGAARAADSYAETRFTEVAGFVPNDVISLSSQAQTSSAALWSESRASLWVTLYNIGDTGYAALVQGDGWLVDGASATDTGDLIGSIVGASPVGVVQ